ncbi:hypothetical protein [Haloferax profundi]|uniref:Uncharacterized protein n=1 Tax=Haloferax profundi TaxID=1544718 RepID=A0A0W1ST50_9EURY|nr:hypothetical protein [Haloferax profundi]KTG29636.1 hypothetical protein AUR66_09535 [Haloferax profundi]
MNRVQTTVVDGIFAFVVGFLVGTFTGGWRDGLRAGVTAAVVSAVVTYLVYGVLEVETLVEETTIDAERVTAE